MIEAPSTREPLKLVREAIRIYPARISSDAATRAIGSTRAIENTAADTVQNLADTVNV
ncbi:hypothetical protein [Pendulispora albinea]|uniref:Uncharacterized protein n=1 Tax=Pendulispora albinea TaxID=2741071 RepID=A0ABZ2LW78_9BACT